MSQQDDQDWFDLVAGRQVPNASAMTQQEAALMQQALNTARAQDSTQSGAIPEHDPIREQALLDRARAAANSTSNSRNPMQPRIVTRVFKQWLHGWRAGFATAALLAVVALVYIWMPLQQSGNQPDAIRGGAPIVYARQVSDPAQASLDLSDALTNAGVKIRRRSEGESWQVEFEVPDTLALEAVKALQQLDIRNPSPGPTMVIVERIR